MVGLKELILTRRPGEKFQIGKDIFVTVVKVIKKEVKTGVYEYKVLLKIEAPPDIRIIDTITFEV